jgi:hypothetical protein
LEGREMMTEKKKDDTPVILRKISNAMVRLEGLAHGDKKKKKGGK